MIAAIAMVAEQRIKESMERGEFEGLPGQGKPLDLDEDANVPEELRMAWKLLKNGGYLDQATSADKPGSQGDLLKSRQEEQRTLRRMLKLQVMEARFARNAGRQARLDGEGGYHAAVVERVRVSEGGGR